MDHINVFKDTKPRFNRRKMSDIIILKEIAEFFSIIIASSAVIYGVNAWKREHVGKRKIELALQVIGKFFEVRDAFKYIRNPFAHNEEGKSRKSNPNESKDDAHLLDLGYIAVERYQNRESVFSEFNTLKYQFMAVFGKDTEHIFTRVNKSLNNIFASARMLATHYWKRQGRVEMDKDEAKRHLIEMYNHEANFWLTSDHTDLIEVELDAIQVELERVTAGIFEESKPRNFFKF